MVAKFPPTLILSRWEQKDGLIAGRGWEYVCDLATYTYPFFSLPDGKFDFEVDFDYDSDTQYWPQNLKISRQNWLTLEKMTILFVE